MAPRVSPKKSWEGAAASAAIFDPGRRRVPDALRGTGAPRVALTAAANVAGQFGDLAESAMKRGAG